MGGTAMGGPHSQIAGNSSTRNGRVPAPPGLPRSRTCRVCEATTSTHKVWLDFNDERWLCIQLNTRKYLVL